MKKTILYLCIAANSLLSMHAYSAAAAAAAPEKKDDKKLPAREKVTRSDGIAMNVKDWVGIRALGRDMARTFREAVTTGQYNPDLSIPDRKDRLPLTVAIRHKSFGLATAMIEEGKADVNGRNNKSATPLHYLTTRDDLPGMRFLLERNAIPNMHDQNGDTPLHLAVKAGNYGAVQLLLENNADYTRQNKDGNTPLHLLNRTDNNGICATLLLDKIRADGQKRFYALHIKNEQGYIAINYIQKNSAIMDGGLLIAPVQVMMSEKYAKLCSPLSSRDKKVKTPKKK